MSREAWQHLTFAEAVDINPKRAVKAGAVVPYVEMAAVPTEGATIEYLLEREAGGGGAKFQNGDTLFARITPCAENGKTAFVDSLRSGETGLGSTELIVFGPKPKLTHPEYVYHLARSELVRGPAISQMVGTTGRARVPNTVFDEIAIPLPPLHEQRRIAEILSSVDEAIAATRAVIEQTRKVKQGVLECLLTKGIGHTRFKKTKIGEIPEGWTLDRIGNIGEVMVGRQRSPSFTDGVDFPYLRVANVFDNHIDTSDVLEMKFTDTELKRYTLEPGDILLNEGQSLHLVGRNARYLGDPSTYCFQNTLIRFRARESTDQDYAFALMQFLFSKGRFSEIATQTTSVAHLGSSRFAAVLVPVPSFKEQQEIGRLHNSLLKTEARQKSQLGRLQSTKSALMSDLLTGRKRVTDALPMAAE